ncbi:MAG: hypothetical protein WD738_09765 [Pirellulales bacterium]
MNLARLFAEQICPVCGCQLEFTPWGRTTQPETPCPCCGIHFGHDDSDPERREAVYKAWRRRWLGYGKRWWRGPEPPRFNPDEQLAQLERLAEDPPEYPGSD